MMARLDTLAASYPTLTLYGDGRLVYHTYKGYYQAHLDEAAVQRLLILAVNEVRFFDLDPYYALPNVYDAPSTRVRVSAIGRTYTSGGQALGYVDESTTVEPRRRLLRLVNALIDLMVEGGAPYVPARVALYAEGGTTDASGSPAPDWPLPGVSLDAALQASNNGKQAALRLTGADAATALQAAPAPRAFMQDGRRYSVVAVPDEP
jgi:hypothetical protein